MWLYVKVPLVVEFVKLIPATLLLPVTPPAVHSPNTGVISSQHGISWQLWENLAA
jgi:hypothetical protein